MRTTIRSLAVLFPFIASTFPISADAQWVYPPPYPAYAYVGESSLRINVKPPEASVYVDGYFAGKVQEFDGKLQRLHVLPGQHELVVYLVGYRSLKQQLYLGPNVTRTIEGTLEKLGAGDEQEPEPKPIAPPRVEPPPDENFPPPQSPQRGPMSRRPTAPEEPPQPPPPPRASDEEPSRFAALAIRVQPGGATIRIDGQQWDGPSGDDRLIIQVGEGHHTIQVERNGYEPYSTEVDVRRGETTPVTVTLRRR